MDAIYSVFAFIVAHFNEIITALVGLITALIGIFLIIPGDSPDKQLQAVVDFLKKFSKK